MNSKIGCLFFVSTNSFFENDFILSIKKLQAQHYSLDGVKFIHFLAFWGHLPLNWP